MDVPHDLSAKISKAVTTALSEEKVPPFKRLLKITFYATGLLSFLLMLVYFAFSEQLTTIWYLAFGGWWLLLTIAFSLYFIPQPRMSIRGNISPWIVGKILISMTILTILEIVICPSFVIFHQAPSWAPFASVSNWFMSWGGMAGCMLLCGLIFTGIGSSLVLVLTSKNIVSSPLKNFSFALGVVYSSQIPIIGIQLSEATLRSTSVYWIMGSLMGVILVGLTVRIGANFVKQK